MKKNCKKIKTNFKKITFNFIIALYKKFIGIIFCIKSMSTIIFNRHTDRTCQKFPRVRVPAAECQQVVG
jgi:hypothetical protein